MKLTAIRKVTNSDTQKVRELVKSAGLKTSVRKSQSGFYIYIGKQTVYLDSDKLRALIVSLYDNGFCLDMPQTTAELIAKNICDSFMIGVKV